MYIRVEQERKQTLLIMTVLETVFSRQKEAEKVKKSGILDNSQEPKMNVTVNRKIDENLTFVGWENVGTDDELAHYHRKDGFDFL